MLLFVILRKIILFFTFILSTMYMIFPENSTGNILKGKRLYNYGNPRVFEYKKTLVKEKEISKENKEIKKKYLDLYKVITDRQALLLCLRDMVFIGGNNYFKPGPATKNNLHGAIVKIDNYLVKSKKVTLHEYYNFIEIVYGYLKKKKLNASFYMPEKTIKSKFIKKTSGNNKNKNTKANQEEEKNKIFKEQLDDYLALRRDMITNLNEDYISFLIPRYEDYKDFPTKEDSFADKYSINEEYLDCPIVFVNYYQYVEYCKWQTFIANEFLFQNLKKEDKILLIFYPISYSEYQYAACCGDPKKLYSCGNFNITDEMNNFKFNFNDRRNVNNDINITKVDKYEKNAFGIYDCNGNTRIWFGSNENDYINGVGNKDWNYKGFSKLLDEGVGKKDVNINEIDKQNLFRMTSKGDCNSRLTDIQNGKYENEHVLSSSPLLGFTIAARVLIYN